MRRTATLTGHVVAPWDLSYETARLDYNARFNNIYPAYIVFCANERDVSEALAWAKRHRVPFRVRSGGHSYEAYSILENGLVIDVSRMNAVCCSAAGDLARIGAGARLIDIYEGLWASHRVTIPGGSCPTVGIAGLTLGGGFGLISRQYGLTMDRVVSMELVDAEGNFRFASQEAHPDLFWALLGAGANNFGVVTGFTFRVVPVGEVAIFSIQWPWDALSTVVPAFQRWADPDTLDRRLTPILTLPARQNGHISVIGEFLGGEDELRPVLGPLLEIPGRTAFTLQTMSYIEAVRRFAGLGDNPAKWQAHGAPGQDTFKNSSAYAYEVFGREALRVMEDALLHTPGPACLVQLDAYGGAVRDVAPDQTAFAHRGARSSMQYQAYWTHPGEAQAHIQWVEAFRQALLPYTQGAYVNYCDARIADWPRAYYGEHLRRLLAIKRRWDPKNRFRFPQGLSELR